MPKWKPLTFDGDFVAGGIEGLVGIEELTDHEDLDKALQAESSGKVAKKRRKKVKQESVPRKITRKNSESSQLQVDDTKVYEKMKSWCKLGIQNELLRALYDKKFLEPTEIQAQCLGPAILGKRDMLGAAQTGSGKTLAFGIPIVSGILKLKEKQSKNSPDDSSSGKEEVDNVDEEDWENDEVQTGCVKVVNLKTEREKNKLYALILTPTRELAVQVKDHLKDLCKYTDVNIALLVGGLAHEKQERLLKKRPEIVVATPGRLWELITMGHVHLQNINEIRFLAIDETDRMLERGHFEELGQILERINYNTEKKTCRQNFVFSATLTLVHEPPSYLKDKKRKRVTPGQKLQDLIKKVGITNPKIVDITSEHVTAENLSEYKIICKFEEKDYYIYHFLASQIGRTIVFCNSIGCVKRLANLLSILNYKPLPLHANMEQKQRLRNLEKFRGTENSLLLATDVAARGLDISNVDHVVHYQVPKTAESYIHRSGRTARGHHSGSSLLLIEPKEHRAYLKLLRTLGRQKDLPDLELSTDTMHHIRKVVKLAREVDALTLTLRKESSAKGWFHKAVEAMDLYVEEDEKPQNISQEASQKIKKDLNLKQKQLKTLMAQPVIPKRFCGKFPDTNLSKFMPTVEIRRDKLKTPGAFVLKTPKMS